VARRSKLARRLVDMTDDLHSLKDDMTAFIEGHGMRRFHGYVNSEDVSSVAWEAGNNPDSWKDFVELAKGAGATFLTMSDFVLSKEDVEYVVDTLRNANYVDEDDVEEARWLRAYTGKTGYVQLGWANNGIVFIYEVSTEWYDRYQRLSEMAEEFGGFVIESGDDE
jgi:hypothetical protein